jgi:CarD family transcriptional regulator, regulator of rRNA transcription
MHFAQEDPIGRRITLTVQPPPPGSPESEWTTIVGVVPNVRPAGMRQRRTVGGSAGRRGRPGQLVADPTRRPPGPDVRPPTRVETAHKNWPLSNLAAWAGTVTRRGRSAEEPRKWPEKPYFWPFPLSTAGRVRYTKRTAGPSAFHSTLQTGGLVTFEVGDKVIYPNHGLGIVERIEEKTILGTTCGFYHLRIVANETTVLVPVSNVDGVGLRRAISDEEVERLFGLLGDGKIDNHQNWKGRFKDNSDKMRSGSIYEVADVLKSLTFLAKSKSLSFREKRMLDRAKFLIISEVSEVMRETAAAIEGRVDIALERCFSAKARTAARAKVAKAAPRAATVPSPRATAAASTPRRAARAS